MKRFEKLLEPSCIGPVRTRNWGKAKRVSRTLIGRDWNKPFQGRRKMLSHPRVPSGRAVSSLGDLGPENHGVSQS
jgi:hypothetical protein